MNSTMKMMMTSISFIPAFSLFGAVTYEIGYFVPIDIDFLRFSTLSDIIVNFVAFLPVFALGLVGLLYFGASLHDAISPEEDFLSRFMSICISIVLVLATGLLFAAHVAFISPFIYALIASPFFWIVLGPMAMRRSNIPLPDNTRRFIGIMVLYFLFCLSAGVFSGVATLRWSANDDILYTSNGGRIAVSVLRSYDKGLLVRRNDISVIEFWPWSQVQSIADVAPKQSVTILCRIIACPPPERQTTRREE